MNEEDVDSALWAFNSKNRKMNTTEERAKHFLTLATKARLTHLDAHIEEAMKLKEAVMSKMMVLFGEFCGTDSNRYKNPPLRKLLTGKKDAFKKFHPKDDHDVDLGDLPDLMAISSI